MANRITEHDETDDDLDTLEAAQQKAFDGLLAALEYVTDPKLRGAIRQWVDHAQQASDALREMETEVALTMLSERSAQYEELLRISKEVQAEMREMLDTKGQSIDLLQQTVDVLKNTIEKSNTQLQALKGAA